MTVLTCKNVLRVFLIRERSVKLKLNGSRSAHGRALILEDVHRRKSSPKRLRALLALQITRYYLDRKRLRGARFSHNEDWNFIQDADNCNEQVLRQRLVESNA